MSKLQTNAIRHLGSAVDNMTLDNAGRVLMPNQPSFSARSNGAEAPAANAVTGFSVIQHNIGGHYSTSTKRFTCPVAGRYFFYAQAMGDSSANRIMLRLRVNGAELVFGSTSAVQYSDIKLTAVFNLAANDYVDVYAVTNFYYSAATTEQWFAGYLIG